MRQNERKRERSCVCGRERESEKDIECMCVVVSKRRERGRGRDETEWERKSVCVRSRERERYWVYVCRCEQKEREWERCKVYSCFIVRSKMDWEFFVKESFRSVRMSWEFFVEESYRSSRVDWLCVCPASKNGCASCQSVQSMSVCVHEAVCNFLTQPIWDSQTKWQIYNSRSSIGSKFLHPIVTFYLSLALFNTLKGCSPGKWPGCICHTLHTASFDSLKATSRWHKASSPYKSCAWTRIGISWFFILWK